MGVDIYQCSSCEECLFDQWVYCDFCEELLETDYGRVCNYCFENDETFEKYKISNVEKCEDVEFTVCEYCAKHYDEQILECEDKLNEWKLSFKHFSENNLKIAVNKHCEKYFGKAAQIVELEIKLKNCEKKLLSIPKTIEKLRKQIVNLSKL